MDDGCGAFTKSEKRGKIECQGESECCRQSEGYLGKVKASREGFEANGELRDDE